MKNLDELIEYLQIIRETYIDGGKLEIETIEDFEDLIQVRDLESKIRFFGTGREIEELKKSNELRLNAAKVVGKKNLELKELNGELIETLEYAMNVEDYEELKRVLEKAKGVE
jgi:hypothetical protein